MFILNRAIEYNGDDVHAAVVYGVRREEGAGKMRPTGRSIMLESVPTRP